MLLLLQDKIRNGLSAANLVNKLIPLASQIYNIIMKNTDDKFSRIFQ